MTYEWKTGAIFKADPQVAGEMCERLAQEDRLTPENLLEENRPVNAPLHDEFEWDDSLAAEKYRKSQAGDIIRSIVVRLEEPPEVVRSFVSIKVEAGDYRYRPLNVVVQNEDMKTQMLRNAFRDFESFRKKYSTLKELSKVFDAFEKLDQESLFEVV